MSEYKFNKFLDKNSPYYNGLVEKRWFKVFNHWLNPLGNYHEPLPFPEKRANEARESFLHPMLYWLIRNPFHNLTHFWIGITPIGQRYEWKLPEENGWFDDGKYFVNLRWVGINGIHIKLPKFNGWVGWQKRGNFRLGLGKS